MFYLIIQLFKEEYEEQVLLALTSAGIERATVSEALNLENVVTMEMPVFAGFRADPGRNKLFCKVITAAVDSETAVEDFLSALEMGGIDFVKDELGVIILIPVAKIIRYRPE